MRPTPLYRAAFIAALIASLALALPGLAGAATSKYPPSAAARGFTGGLAGWTSSMSNEGACLAPVLCASVENSYQASGGADGHGFIRSAYTGAVGAMAVAGTTTAVWQSPAFPYEGASGEEPVALSFAFDRRASVDQLLAVAGNSADFSVQLVDISEDGETLALIGPTTLAGANTWTKVSGGSVDPESLTPGDEYLLQITTRYTTGTSVLVSGSADYDNVVLSASDGKGRNGGGRGKGKVGGGSSGTLSEERLESLLRQTTPGTAVLGKGGKRLFVRVRCPRKVGNACRTTAQGLLRKHRPATTKRTVRLRRGRSRLLALRVKPKARKQVAKRRRLLVRQKVHTGKVTATIFKSRRLVRR
ncbi:MAG: hypothetical protein ACRDLL_02500 [Solirubrobacterales bacterium]